MCPGAGWSEYGRRSSWWAIITYKVIKDIGRQRAEVEAAAAAAEDDGGRRDPAGGGRAGKRTG